MATKDKILEAENMAFFGTKCVEGKGIGVVVLTGPKTIIGRIANLAQSAVQGETTLAVDLERFMKLIALFAVTLGVVFFCIAFVYNADLVANFVYAIGIIVANVPEGLLITLTITLAATANRLAENNVLVKNLQAVETLGSTSCICSDKTGTLTQNRMAPAHVFVGRKEYDCSMAADEYQDELKKGKNMKELDYMNSELFKKFTKYLALCSAVELAEPDDDEIYRQIARDLKVANPKSISKEIFETNRQSAVDTLIKATLCKDRKTMFGNPTEAGMIKLVASFQDYKQIREESPLIFEIPFSSALKYNLMIRKIVDPATKKFVKYIVLMKGAAERVLCRCNKIDNGEAIVDKTDELNDMIDKKNTEYASRGERVLGLAFLELDPEQFPESTKFIGQGEKHNVPTTNLVFFGLMSLMDPPRTGVEKSVDRCREAGIKVIMVTGDQPETAKAIAFQCHIITDLSYEYHNMINAGMPQEEAETKCNVSELFNYI